MSRLTERAKRGRNNREGGYMRVEYLVVLLFFVSPMCYYLCSFLLPINSCHSLHLFCVHPLLAIPSLPFSLSLSLSLPHSHYSLHFHNLIALAGQFYNPTFLPLSILFIFFSFYHSHDLSYHVSSPCMHHAHTTSVHFFPKKKN